MEPGETHDVVEGDGVVIVVIVFEGDAGLQLRDDFVFVGVVDDGIVERGRLLGRRRLLGARDGKDEGKRPREQTETEEKPNEFGHEGAR